jgi:uncharacterized membrane protein YdjX (TVP38/TMEM64 family)
VVFIEGALPGRATLRYLGVAGLALGGFGVPGWSGAMELVRKIVMDRRFYRLAWVGSVFGFGLLLFAWRMGLDWEDLRGYWVLAEGFLRERPWFLFAALVVLPGFPVPMSALLVLAGTVWRDRPAAACGIALAAMLLNMSWTYWAAAGPARRLVEKVLVRGRSRIPKLPAENHLHALLILRLTPGIPFFLQNYALGFLHVPFRLYAIVSMASSGLVSCGILLSGAGLAGGGIVPILTGLGLIVVGVVVVRLVKGKMLKS